MAPPNNSNPATAQKPIALVNNAYSIRSWPCSSRASRVRRWSISVTSNEGERTGRGPPDALLPSLGDQRRHRGDVGGHLVVPSFQVGTRCCRTRRRDDRNERRQQRVLDEVLALIFPNKPNKQTLHVLLRAKRLRSGAASRHLRACERAIAPRHPMCGTALVFPPAAPAQRSLRSVASAVRRRDKCRDPATA